MSKLNTSITVGQCVAEHPQTARVFEDLNIDYCCGGNTTLTQACDIRQLDAGEVLEQLTAAISDPEQQHDQSWLDAPLKALCDHIEATHHAYLRQELPRLAGLIDKVTTAHGESHPELTAVQTVFASLRSELEPHMLKEEKVLFPAIRLLESAQSRPNFPFGTVANPIRMMEHDHDSAGQALQALREITRSYEIPPDACATYTVMLDSLRALEADMHQHVHKENNILFPRAQQLEAVIATK